MRNIKIIKPRIELLTTINNDMLKRIEKIARVCYKSEEKITEYSYVTFCKKLMRRNHLAMIEHESIAVKITCDRGIANELVRHRIASYAQESTRYCNYEGKLEVIRPLDVVSTATDTEFLSNWEAAMSLAENYYSCAIKMGVPPQIARSVLPLSTKTEIVITANLREWINILKLRTAENAHPQMRVIMWAILKLFRSNVIVIFDDIEIPNFSELELILINFETYEIRSKNEI